MARFGVGARTTAGSTTLPVISLYAAASTTFNLVEIGVSNTTATSVALCLCKMTTTGTQGTGLVEQSLDAGGGTSATQAFNTHSVAPTLLVIGYNITLGAAVGSGWVWTFGNRGMSVPVGTGNGIGVIVASGTGQALDSYLVWDE